jgi:hypothetical protein
MCVFVCVFGVMIPGPPCAAEESKAATTQPEKNSGREVHAVLVDGRSITGRWMGLDKNEVRMSVDRQIQKLSMEKLLSIRFKHDRITTNSTQPNGVKIWLSNGSKLLGELVGKNGNAIVLQHVILGKLDIALEEMAGLRVVEQENSEAEEKFQQTLSDPAETKDILLLVRNGQVNKVEGIVESFGPEGGTFKWRERDIRLPADQVYGIVFAAGLGEQKQPGCQCRLISGDVLTGELTGGDEQNLYFQTAFDEKHALPLNKVESLRLNRGRMVFLSDLEPVNYEFEAFGGTRWPYRMDRSVSNGPLRIAEQTYERGIGVHARSILTFELQNDYQTFAADIGIDEAAGEYGNVLFRVTADGTERFTSKPVSGNDEARSISVDIKGIKELQLIVDFGKDLDIGDHANWANARLIK